MALKTCKDCGAEVSEKAFACPKCGASDPTGIGAKYFKGFVIIIMAAFFILVFFFMSLGSAQTPERKPRAEAEEALEYIKGLDWVKDAVYQDYSLVQWQIGVINDGRNMKWAAQSICDMLSLRGLVDESTNVRMVDIKKVSQGLDFRTASLGRLNCSTGEQNNL